MTTKTCQKKHRKHTPIVSEAQRGFFGAELARAREGKARITEMPQAELGRHLKEAKGKKLVARKKTKKALARSRELRKQLAKV